jgi:hypothetical protein
LSDLQAKRGTGFFRCRVLDCVKRGDNTDPSISQQWLRFVGGFLGCVICLGSFSVRVGGRLEAGIDPSLSLRAATGGFLGGFHPAGESLYLTGGVNDSLLTGVERVAHAAEVGAEILPG